MIIDEAQRVPELFSFIQVLVDQTGETGQFILTGSHNFLLMKSIKQSLAGRVATLHLLPLSLAELQNRPALDLGTVGFSLPKCDAENKPDLLSTLHDGGYPRIHDQKISPGDWMANYVRTYVERDVQEVLRVSDLEVFGRFLGLCAGRSGQLIPVEVKSGTHRLHGLFLEGCIAAQDPGFIFAAKAKTPTPKWKQGLKKFNKSQSTTSQHSTT